MSDENNFLNLPQHLPYARPLSPLLATRMLNALKDEHFEGVEHATLNHLARLRRAGITLTEVLESGALKINGIEAIFSPENFNGLAIDSYCAPVPGTQPEAPIKEEWISQGGNEVHYDDKDMQIPELKTQHEWDSFEAQAFLRVMGSKDSADPATVMQSLESLSLNGHLYWDNARMQQAAANLKPGREIK